MMHHFSWFHHFLKPIHHFTGASFLCVTMLLFGGPSFYRNIILLELQIWVHHFTSQLLKISAVSIILQVHFVTLKLTETDNFFTQNPLAADRTCAFRWETDTAVLPPLFYWIRARNYSVYTLGWWVAEITPTHTMSVQSTDQTTPSTACGFLVLTVHFLVLLLVEFGRKHSSASFYRFNFGS